MEQEQREQERGGFFDLPSDQEVYWRQMPSFYQANLEAFQSIKIHFSTKKDRDDFAKLLGRSITPRTRYLWFPKNKTFNGDNARFVSRRPRNPRYPVYVISKGRWETGLTVKELEYLHVPYHVVIEPQEYDQYAAVIDTKKILKLPFSNLGKGSIPARNWVWEHAIKMGAARHWILDDNIGHFYRLCDNYKVRVADGTIFVAAEEFVDRFENVALAGFNYHMFAPRKDVIPPYYINTRIYSCILIKNDIPYRWRGRYNEDTDLSLRALKDGWCTFLFNAFLSEKKPTMSMKGGNTDELYKDDGRMKMAQSLLEQHPDVTIINHKWGRWQHQVDYRPFRKNKPIMRKNLSISDGDDDYEMELVGLDE
jgi:hypothetical protein